jgi:hypothetical protein
MRRYFIYDSLCLVNVSLATTDLRLCFLGLESLSGSSLSGFDLAAITFRSC